MRDASVIFLKGVYGVGKSAVLEHLGDLLARWDRPFSLMDVDWFHRSWPPAADDPDDVVIEAANMRAVWAGYRSAGPRQLVVSGVVRSSEERRRYEAALGLPLRVVLLTASSETVEARLRSRYPAARSEALQWHLDRHDELATRLLRLDLHGAVFVTDAERPDQVARAVLDALGVRPAEGAGTAGPRA